MDEKKLFSRFMLHICSNVATCKLNSWFFKHFLNWESSSVTAMDLRPAFSVKFVPLFHSCIYIRFFLRFVLSRFSKMICIKKMSMIFFRLGLGEFWHSSKKIMLHPSGFNRHPFGSLVPHLNEHSGSILSFKDWLISNTFEL